MMALLYFGVACAASIIVACVLGALLKLACARWPAFAAHRSVWLTAQGAVVLVFALACLPLPRSPVAPTLALAQASAETAQSTEIASSAISDAALEPAPAATEAQALSPARLVLDSLPVAWLGVYLAGLLWHAAASLRTQRRWHALLLHQVRVVGEAELRAWPALTAGQRAQIASLGLTVRTTGLPVSPMLLGVLRPCLLLPAHLFTLDLSQQRLIVAHELAHWQRRDPLWLTLSGALGLAFWFNRPFRRLNGALREAVELGCDDAVLAGRSSGERQGYASALVAQMRLQLQWQAGPAFGSLGVVARVQRMQARRPLRLSGCARTVTGAGLLAIAAAGAALLPSFSVASAPMSSHAVAQASPLAPAWRYPLSQVRVTALYGVRSTIVPSGHHGVDFAAKRGTPVHAVAAGTIVEAAFNPAWGHYVRVDHGAGVSSLLIHLERVAVAYGSRVAAGDLLGASGASGKATGAHLHLEYWLQGRRLDPRIMLADLNDHATSNALARRQAQGNPSPTDQ